MAILPNFPLLTQQTPITGDGKPSEDATFECVTTCVLASLMYLLHVKAMDGQWNPDTIKDAVYGQGYTGGTAASRYVDYCKAKGVTLWSFQGAPSALVNEIHTQLAKGKPVIVTVPDIYVPASYGWTHVLVAYADGQGQITMLDPWPGRPTTKSDAEWTALLLDNEVWIMEDEHMTTPLDITMPAVAALFKELSPTSWQSLATNSIIHDGLLSDFKANGQASLDYLGDVVQNEVGIGPGKSLQRHAKGVRVWDNGHVSSLPLYVEGPGQDPWVDKLKTALTAEQATNAQLQAQLAALQSQPAAPVLSAAQLAALEALAAAFGHTLV